MQLVYLSPVPWSDYCQRPHKFVEWFHSRTGSDVLWIDPYPTRFPNIGDLNRISIKRDVLNCCDLRWLKVIRPKAIPIEPLPYSNYVNARFWTNIFKEFERFILKAPTMLAIGKPSLLALELLNRVKGIPIIYDAMDDFANFYNSISRSSMAKREKAVVQQANYFFVSSTTLKKRWQVIRRDVKLVRNGLDIHATPEPKIKTSNTNRKVLGYLGTIGHWFDWNWIIALAKIRPYDTVRLIGPVNAAPPGRLPENIEILPPLRHELALKAVLDFDVGLIPFKINDLTASVDPIKYYEYRALGLPVVSTLFGEMNFRVNENGTFLSHGLQDIDDLIVLALSYKPDKDSIQQFRINNSWNVRFGEMGILT